jgi:hypothetical protein
MILPQPRDPRFITRRRGGTLEDGARAAAPGDAEGAGRLECAWERGRLPARIRDLVLDDQRLRNRLCWSAFGPA